MKLKTLLVAVFIYNLLPFTVKAETIKQQLVKDTNLGSTGNPRQDFSPGVLAGELKSITLSLSEVISPNLNEFQLVVACAKELVNREDCPEQTFVLSNSQSIKGSQKDYTFNFPAGFVFNPLRSYTFQIIGSETAWGAVFYGSAVDVFPDTTLQNIVDSHGNQSPYQGIADLYFKIDTLANNPQKQPVIIIPGILGTKLNQNFGDHDEIWPNVRKMIPDFFDNFLKDLSLDFMGNEKEDLPIVAGDVVKDIAIGRIDTFDSMIKYFKDQGYVQGKDLFLLPYDWRFDIRKNRDSLDAKVQDALQKNLGFQKVDIIAHSMGGLLAKDYASQHANKVDQLIYIGTPQIGSPKAFKTLLFGDNLGFPFFLNEQTIKEITQNMPSVYQLLPSSTYVDENDLRYVVDARNEQPQNLNYLSTRDLMISFGSNELMFPLAESLHSSLDVGSLSEIETHSFVGCGVSTLNEIILKKKQNIQQLPGGPISGLTEKDYDLRYVSSGDGTVPSQSSLYGSLDNYYVNEVSHANLPSATGVYQEIFRILNPQVPIVVIGNDHVSKDPTTCKKLNGHMVSSHSPVDLHIYDQENRHTGPTSNGIEYGIPGVAYDVIDHAKFAFLPEGPTYNVVNEATATGSYDFYFRTVQNDQITNTSYYHSIPLSTQNTQTEIIIDNSSTMRSVSVDIDGNGTIDRIIQPSSQGSMQQAEDLVPPVTSLVIDKEPQPNGWYFSNVTLDLIASDDNASILETRYSVDGGQWVASSSVALSDGVHTMRYFSIDKAGNYESIKERVIKIDTKAPEARIFFDTNTKKLSVMGIDEVSKVSVQPIIGGYTLKDESGHELKIEIKQETQLGQISAVSIKKLVYDGQTIQVPQNKVIYAYINDKQGIKLLNQDFILQNSTFVATLFTRQMNKTRILTKDYKQTPGITELPGLVPLSVVTKIGKLGYELK